MQTIREFLDSSTIHGLAYISSPKTDKATKVFWACVVIAGISTAGFLINNSYTYWIENPVSTTISTHPISELKFPRVTVCPPAGSNTALNYDLMNLNKSKSLDDEIRQSLAQETTKLSKWARRQQSRLMLEALNNVTISNIYHGYDTIPRLTQVQSPNNPTQNNYYIQLRTQDTNISSPKFGSMVSGNDDKSDQLLEYNIPFPEKIMKNLGDRKLIIDIELNLSSNEAISDKFEFEPKAEKLVSQQNMKTWY